MKKNLVYFAAVLLLFSCKDDDDATPGFQFKNQDVSGKINGVSWAYNEGSAEMSSEQLRINLFLDQPEPVCEIVGFPDGDQVFFTIPNKIGLYKLNFDLGGGASQTLTLLDIEETLNIICTDGAIEILTITSTQVTGRIDARSGPDDFVNGNFTATLCQ